MVNNKGEILIISNEDLEIKSRDVPEVKTRFEPKNSGIAHYDVNDDVIVVGGKAIALAYSENQLHGILRHEKTHYVYFHLLPEEQQEVCDLIARDANKYDLYNFYRSRIKAGDYLDDYDLDTWLSDKKQELFSSLKRGYFARKRMVAGEKQIYLPHVISELLASLSQDNDFSYSSDQSGNIGKGLVLIANKVFSQLSPQTKRRLREFGLINVTAYNELRNVTTQIEKSGFL